MTWLNKINPTPAFPPYTGPYKVGSVDVEIPTSQLESPGKLDSPSTDPATVSFRVFYPARPESEQKGVRWIPSPQKEVVSSYAKFLGAGNAMADLFANLPQLLYYIKIPVHHNADILEPPTQSKRWPVTIFSHGLGGSRNAYSHICGLLASHGVVVVAPEHRDGSCPVSFVNTPEEKEKLKRVEYKKISHKASTEVYDARDEQLRVRLWELGLIHDALLKIDGRVPLKNVAEDYKKTGGKDMLTMLSRILDVHEPGKISFAGHSFGGATTVQFVKSVYYHNATGPKSYRPLFMPNEDSNIIRQITPQTPVMLLDLWCLPLQSPSTVWLRNKPLPCYDSPAGGSSLLAILSEAFYKWSANLNDTKRTVSKPTGSAAKYPDQPGPHIFYPVASAHLSQSDFGVLFPWVTTKVFGAKEPERVLRLNARAMLQVMRNAGIEVAATSKKDMELQDLEGLDKGVPQDEEILSHAEDSVRGWISLRTELNGGKSEVSKGPGDAMVEGEALGQVMSNEERGTT
ncbi:hypothetical protein BU23DRAFT_462322 [Bimuria novae-zelandiae CBS 107.79]|uniref:Putative phospholipase n=1 Tax=Bimuria novae-zelandiae CBS 107.79 TaxID=1447943 RepID=A0A6A5VDU5_9PLEO|nr:hypothetical protein BU23DRAFT_462322 [Bimuria novae-zelandiae CBS 107.79]